MLGPDQLELKGAVEEEVWEEEGGLAVGISSSMLSSVMLLMSDAAELKS